MAGLIFLDQVSYSLIRVLPQPQRRCLVTTPLQPSRSAFGKCLFPAEETVPAPPALPPRPLAAALAHWWLKKPKPVRQLPALLPGISHQPNIEELSPTTRQALGTCRLRLLGHPHLACVAGTCTSSCPTDGPKHPPLFLGIGQGASAEGVFLGFVHIIGEKEGNAALLLFSEPRRVSLLASYILPRGRG